MTQTAWSDGYFAKVDGKWLVRVTTVYPRVGTTLSVRRKNDTVERVVTRIVAEEGKSRIGGGGKTYLVEVR